MPAALLAWVVAASAAMGSDSAGQERHPADPLHVVHRLELGAGAPSASVTWSTGSAATLYAWARSETLDPVVHVRDASDGFLAEDRGAGGMRTPCVEVQLAEPGTLTVRVAALEAGSAGRVDLHLISAPEGAETLDAGLWGSEAYDAVIALRNQGDRARAREELSLVLDELHGLPGAGSSAIVAELSMRFGIEAGDSLEDYELAGRAWSHALAHRLRCLPDDHPEVLRAQEEVAQALWRLGDLAAARRLLERAHESATRSLRADDLFLLRLRGNLATVVKDQGDLQAARELEEQVLEMVTRQLPEEDERVLRARTNLAITLTHLEEHEAARRLEERLLAVLEASLPDSHPHVQRARENLAATLQALGRDGESLRLQRSVLETRVRELPDAHPDVQRARINLARSMDGQDQQPEAREMLEVALEHLTTVFPDGHNLVLAARAGLAWTCVRLGDGRAVAELARAIGRGVDEALGSELVASTPREVVATALGLERYVSGVLSFAEGAGGVEPDLALDRAAFALLESVRGAGLRTARMLAGSAYDPELGSLRRTAQRASARLASLVDAGADRDRIARARRRMERAQRAMLERLAERPGSRDQLVAADAGALAGRLRADEALIGFWRYTRTHWDPEQPKTVLQADSLVAFVLRADGSLRRCELGTLGSVERAVERWRAALIAGAQGSGVRGGPVAGAAPSPDPERAAGEALRRLVVDPWAADLDDVRTLVLAPDDVLHAVPLDALPIEGGRLGERYRIQVRNTLWETLAPPPAGERRGTLVALGDPAYGDPDALDTSDAWRSRWEAEASDLRAVTGRAPFRPLEATREEVRTIARLHDAERAGRPAVLLEGARADRSSLAAHVARARYLHLATHGWFAPDTVGAPPTARDLDPRAGTASALSLGEQVRGLSPLVLCGLALAGANGGSRAEGLITAAEIANWELADCELAVLSACDTNVGIRRAGQGVASLQMALHMAGARSVVTSLWKVPDAATKELMVAFYRHLWVEGLPKDRALWKAKMAQRDAVDAAGLPVHGPRDWAGWVLTGEPD